MNESINSVNEYEYETTNNHANVSSSNETKRGSCPQEAERRDWKHGMLIEFFSPHNHSSSFSSKATKIQLNWHFSLLKLLKNSFELQGDFSLQIFPQKLND